ncbi:hypothetical protein CDO26_09350 [Sinorhizobium meliloti]|uniref:hypothetical protein n=1 Tax=Rhizobium meliloti TaxID=382 RepID=UPI000B4A5034|nr:hypothetical protein [Sinorhizobium meliloti]ASP84781.1 hypothetical protein CDO26_09350 [Sinorhizobium meliloti]MDX0182722.1 hypothetical protein [Sinorhizobium meliloti]MQW27078.1 hypothetical protein [Sinorhizobium meliloti]
MSDVDENGLLEGEVELWRNAQWRVTSDVLEEFPGSGRYWISASEVHDPMWPAHMADKKWVDHGLFMEALAKARELHPQRADYVAGKRH